jgi:hypothetical protein
VYTFPEVAPILGLLLLPLFLPAPAGQRRFAGLAIAVVTAVILLAPGADSLRAYMQHQVAAATPAGDAVRPGGDFAGRLATAPLDLAAWWALGTQHRRPPLPEVVLGGLFACGLLLTALAVVGMARLGRQGGWRELSVLGLTGASLGYFVLVDRYGYGAYKILSVTWWLVGRCVVEGCAAAVTVVRTRAPASAAGRVARGLTVAVVGGVLLAGGLVTGAQRLFSYFRAADLPPTLPALDRLRAAAASQPPMDVLVARALADRTTLMWILYALKDTRLRLYHESPVPAGIPGEATWSSDRPVPRAVLLRPRDVRGVTFRFETPEFALVDLESNPFVEVIDSSNEPEPWGTWLGTRPITLALLAPPGLAVTLAFEALPGPSRPDSPRRTIVLHAGAREIGRVQIDGPATVTFPFVAAGGREVLTLSTPDFPTVARLPGGDARTQLVGIRNLTAGRAAAPGVTP